MENVNLTTGRLDILIACLMMRAGMCAYLIYEKWFCSASLACHEQTESRSHHVTLKIRHDSGETVRTAQCKQSTAHLSYSLHSLTEYKSMMVLHTFFMLGGHRCIRTERKCLFIFVDFYILLYFVNIKLCLSLPVS